MEESSKSLSDSVKHELPDVVHSQSNQSMDLARETHECVQHEITTSENIETESISEQLPSNDAISYHSEFSKENDEKGKSAKNSELSQTSLADDCVLHLSEVSPLALQSNMDPLPSSEKTLQQSNEFTDSLNEATEIDSLEKENIEELDICGSAVPVPSPKIIILENDNLFLTHPIELPASDTPSDNSDRGYQEDLLVEEMIVNDVKIKEQNKDQLPSHNFYEDISLATSTEYRNLDDHSFQPSIYQKVLEMKSQLNESEKNEDLLREQNKYLQKESLRLQHSSETHVDLSDLYRYEKMSQETPSQISPINLKNVKHNLQSKLDRLFRNLQGIEENTINILKENLLQMIDELIDCERNNLSKKHETELVEMRTYYEGRLSKQLEASYHETSSHHTIPDGGGDTSIAKDTNVDYEILLETTKSNTMKLEIELADTKQKHSAYIKELNEKHKIDLLRMEEQISELKCQLSAFENCDQNVSVFQQDVDDELEKASGRQLGDRAMVLEEIQALLSDPDVTNWPQQLEALCDKIQAAERDVPGIREEVSSGKSEFLLERRQRRNLSFDQNRQIEAVARDRDKYKNLSLLLKHAIDQLMEYVKQADEEFNSTFHSDLLVLDVSHVSESSLLETSDSVLSAGRLHIAPDISTDLINLDVEDLIDHIEEQRIISKKIDLDLESALKKFKSSLKVLFEFLLRGSNVRMIQSAIAHLAPDATEDDVRRIIEAVRMDIPELNDSQDFTGYGEANPPPMHRQSLPSVSSMDDRSQLLRDCEDLRNQLEEANRQLNKTKKFLEEQAEEREKERDLIDTLKKEIKNEKDKYLRLQQTNERLDLETPDHMQMHLRTITELNNYIKQCTVENNELNEALDTVKQQNEDLLNDIVQQNDVISGLRERIREYEDQDSKSNEEENLLEELKIMKETIDDRDQKMRDLVKELEVAKSVKVDDSVYKCTHEDVSELHEQVRFLEEFLNERTQQLERIHESSISCGEFSEDVSIREKNVNNTTENEEQPIFPRSVLSSTLHESASAHNRALHHALKFFRDIVRTTQELRAERDVLQRRLSSASLRASSLSAQLQRMRSRAEGEKASEHAELCVAVGDATAEIQRLTEELDAKDKQIFRLKKTIDVRKKLSEQHEKAYPASCKPEDKVVILERELLETNNRLAELEVLYSSIENEKENMRIEIEEYKRELEDKKEQMNEYFALNLDEENQKSDLKSEILEGGKNSARTLSDIVSLSDYDEQDLQMRKAELNKTHNLSGIPYPDNGRDKSGNKTLPPDVQRPQLSSLNLELTNHFDLVSNTPKADSLPPNMTYRKGINDTALGTIQFGDSVKHSTAFKIQDNISIYPNRDVSDSKGVTIEPKKINFSLEPSKTQDDTLKELGINTDHGNYPDILSQLKRQNKIFKSELNNYETKLKNAEEQLEEFPALKREVEELKAHLEETLATMKLEKNYYEKQLDNFETNKTNMEQRLNDIIKEADKKTSEISLLKDDLTCRENLIMKLAKEKNQISNRMNELEMKIDELTSRNNALQKFEADYKQMREKLVEINKLEQLVTEKNQQIDSLNQHLDRFDDLQLCLNEKTDQLEALTKSHDIKTEELRLLRNSMEATLKELNFINETNNKLVNENNELKLKLDELEKEKQEQSIKHQSNDIEVRRLTSLNEELTFKIDELKQVTEKLKDKEIEISILEEDMKAYHEEIAKLNDQLKSVSRSPSPRNNLIKEGSRINDDKKQLAKIKKEISMLQHELKFNKEELNNQAYELSKAKLNTTELTKNLSEASKQISNLDLLNKQLKENNNKINIQLEQLTAEKQQLTEQMAVLMNKIREESNTVELKNKLRKKIEECDALEKELTIMKELIERPSSTLRARSACRSPTQELEGAVREELHYSLSLDDQFQRQMLSGESDIEEIPRLALSVSKSPSPVSSIHMSDSHLTQLLEALKSRLNDKDIIISELNREREKLVKECETAQLRFETERDNCLRLQILLDKHKDNADSMQNDEANIIEMLKSRLESAMSSEVELQQNIQMYRSKALQLEMQIESNRSNNSGKDTVIMAELKHEREFSDRLREEANRLRLKLTDERARQQQCEREIQHLKQALEAQRQKTDQARSEMAEITRLKREVGLELLRAKELINIQSANITELQNKKTDKHVHMDFDRKFLLDRDGAHSRKSIVNDEDRELAIRYLHGRCIRFESWHKSLVWQKRYLLRELDGYKAMERKLLPRTEYYTTPLERFRYICVVIRAIHRMKFLVVQKSQIRTLTINTLHDKDQYRTKSSHASPIVLRSTRVNLPDDNNALNDALIRRSPYYNSPSRIESILHSSPRSDTAAAYLRKLTQEIRQNDANRSLNYSIGSSRK